MACLPRECTLKECSSVAPAEYKFTVRMPTASAASTTLEGAVDRVTFYNPENGFSVLRVRVRGRREPVAVVGILPAVQPGEQLRLQGQWHTDARHGAQFRPEHAEVRPPAALEDIQRYLGSGLIRQIGPVLAQRIVQSFGEATLQVLDTQPERVREVPGVGAQRARSIAAAWTEHRALRAVAAFLSEHGLDTRYAPRLVGIYGPDAPRVLAANPYRLVGDVPGLGFAAADRLGQSLDIRPAAVPRLQAAVQSRRLAWRTWSRASSSRRSRSSRRAARSRPAAPIRPRQHRRQRNTGRCSTLRRFQARQYHPLLHARAVDSASMSRSLPGPLPARWAPASTSGSDSDSAR